jgi:hypothetical protein
MLLRKRGSNFASVIGKLGYLSCRRNIPHRSRLPGWIEVRFSRAKDMGRYRRSCFGDIPTLRSRVKSFWDQVRPSGIR